ncbi:hypothetical protein [Streptomyces sp. NRRL S-146]|uniref:hypothetical protein n=1 Tax=Streptomyces sp. NRRL S-146 TaxID=1463884 RepID=UPI00131A9D86|nr:hypothetical protein [Streptomyces sp. NRRL S-146]
MDDSWIRGDIEPLIGKTSMVSMTSWDFIALYHPKAFARALSDLGLSDEQVSEILAIRDQMAPELDQIDRAELVDRLTYKMMPNYELLQRIALARRRLVERLEAWFRGRTVRVNSSRDVDVRIPLFVLSAPDAAECKASFERSDARGRALGWNVSVFGSGMAGAANLRTTASWKFSANRAERKLVFMSVRLTVLNVTIFERGRALERRQHIDISNLRCQNAPGLILLAPDVDIPCGELLNRYPLAGDTSGAIAEYEYRYEQSSNNSLEIGVSVPSSNVKAQVQISVDGTMTLRHELRGGFNYSLHRLAEGHGILWPAPNAAQM